MSDSWEIRVKKAEVAKYEAETRKLDLESRHLMRRDDWLEVETGETPEHLIYSFNTPVEPTSVRECIHWLTRWTRRWPGEKITILFNSPGGEVLEGLALFDFLGELRASGHEIETVSIGWTASMAGILLQAGDTRVMTKNAIFLIHEISSIAYGKTSEVEDSLKFTQLLQTKVLDILAERSTLSQNEIADKWQRKDWWLDADEALELGFIDEIRGL